MITIHGMSFLPASIAEPYACQESVAQALLAKITFFNTFAELELHRRMNTTPVQSSAVMHHGPFQPTVAVANQPPITARGTAFATTSWNDRSIRRTGTSDSAHGPQPGWHVDVSNQLNARLRAAWADNMPAALETTRQLLPPLTAPNAATVTAVTEIPYNRTENLLLQRYSAVLSAQIRNLGVLCADVFPDVENSHLVCFFSVFLL